MILIIQARQVYTNMKTRQKIEDQNWEVLHETDQDFNERLIYNNMKRIKVFGASEVMVGYNEGEPLMLTNCSHNHFENEELFTVYDPKQIYEIYKVLEEANKKGAFDSFEDDVLFEKK